MKYDLVGKRCIVTGATSGIGREIARNLAYFGATVVLPCRDRNRGGATLEELAEETGNDRLCAFEVDLTSARSIRTFVRNVTAGGAPVHVLIHAAAVYSSTRQETVDGHERTWATNALAPFLLGCLLMPRMLASAPARIVHLSCEPASSLELDDLHLTRRPYTGDLAFAQSKQGLEMLSLGMAHRVHARKVSVHACLPGRAPTRLLAGRSGARAALARLGGPFAGSTLAAARGPTYVAAEPGVHERSGQLWKRGRIAPPRFPDVKAVDDLWERCVAMAEVDLPR